MCKVNIVKCLYFNKFLQDRCRHSDLFMCICVSEFCFNWSYTLLHRKTNEHWMTKTFTATESKVPQQMPLLSSVTGTICITLIYIQLPRERTSSEQQSFVIYRVWTHSMEQSATCPLHKSLSINTFCQQLKIYLNRQKLKWCLTYLLNKSYQWQ